MITRRMLIIVAAVILAFAAWRFFRTPEVRNEDATGTTIVAFGDSLTAGTGAGQGQDYPSVLSGLIGRPVINAGVPGETAEDALARVERDVIRRNPRIVIVLLGGNDLLQRKPRGDTVTAIREIVERLQDAGALVMLVGIDAPYPLGGLSSEYKKIARELQAAFVPDILEDIVNRPSLKADQVHPNAAGYKIVAERIAKALRPYL